jgi:hypothetical protein
MEKLAPKFAEIAKATIVALIGSLLLVMPISGNQALATGISHNDGTCDLSATSGVYQIQNARELWEVTDCVGAGDQTFRLVANIDVASSGDAPTGSPIGLSQSGTVATFSGVLQGNGFEVSGLAMSASGGVGLFALVSDATINDLTLRGDLTSSPPVISAQNSAGALAVRASGTVTISNVVNRVNVFGRENAGGLIGHNLASFSIVAKNFGNVVATGNYAGGFIGNSRALNTSQGFIDSSENHGVIKSAAYVGGFVGYITNRLKVTNSSNGGKISAPGSAVSGMVGHSGAPLEFISASNTADVTGMDWSAGGLAGYAGIFTTVSRSVNSGQVSGGLRTGGLIGYSQNGSNISESENRGAVSASAGVGGLVGLSWTTLVVSSSSNSGSIRGNTSAGGLLGSAALAGSQVTISYGVNTGPVINASAATSTAFGGLIGQASGPVYIVSSRNEANISASNKVGGVVGDSYGQIEVSATENRGTVSASIDFAGGLVGSSRAVSLSKFVNFGDVSVGRSFVGGVIGQATAGPITFSQVANLGAVRASSISGGLIGALTTNVTAILLNVHNAAPVTAQTRNAGFIGDAASNSPRIQYALQVGSISNAMSKDSLVVNASASSSILDVYSDQPSSWSETLASTSLSRDVTYVGWNLTDVWGFPNCQGNLSYPVLRFSFPSTPLYSTGCPLANNQAGSQGGSSGQSGQSTNAPSSDIRYVGPTVQTVTQEVLAGSQVTFVGTKLDLIDRAIVASLEVEIVSKTSMSLVVVLPATLSSGGYDVDFYSEFGRLTVLALLNIKSVVPAPVPESTPTDSKQAELIGWKWSPRFDGNSRSLNIGQQQALEASLMRFSGAKTVVCWGYTTSKDPSDWAIAHATARAQALCDWVATKMSVKTAVGLSFGAPKPHAVRASIQFWR